MDVYIETVMILNFTVNFLLLLGTNRLTGFPPGIGRVVSAALLGSLYAGVCLLPRTRFLGSFLWRLTVLMLMGLTAFGLDKSALRRGFVFALLQFALCGLAAGMERRTTWNLLLLGICLTAAACWYWQERQTASALIPVELRYQNRTCRIMALQDSGNLLRDPLTGERVMVAGAELGRQILNLSPRQLSLPAQTLAQGLARGARLIPYRSVGQPNGLLLAIRLKEVKIGSWKGDALVAFAPTEFGPQEGYQMLLGGTAWKN